MPVPTDDERRRRTAAAQRWLTSKWSSSHSCPICASNAWTITEMLQLLEFTNEAVNFSGEQRVMPVFPVTCDVCGYTFMINGIVAGIVGLDDQYDARPE